MTCDTDTIAAVATGPAPGPIGVIRLSGSEAFVIAQRVFRGTSFSADTAASHRIYYGHAHDPRTGEALDEVLLMTFRAPKSYTGEDVIEISCHGGPYVLARVLDAVTASGARHAQPGEFTLRAYLNGRMDLAQAEAVADIIQARSEAALRVALHQREGWLSKKIVALRRSLEEACAYLEASLEYEPEEGGPDPAGIRGRVDDAYASVTELLRSVRLGRILREGFRLAIIGRPNAGKSTLLNALAGRDRVLVSPAPGTTRDVIEETISLDGAPLTLLDTAGIRRPRGLVEAAGVSLALDTASRADGVMVVLDAARGWSDTDATVVRAAAGKCLVVLWNKSDLVSPRRAQSLLRHPALSDAPKPVLAVSAATGAGLPELERLLAQRILGSGDWQEHTVVLHERHAAALDEARQALEAARGRLERDDEAVLVAADVREAADALGQVVGATTTEDVVRQIFARFCMGK